ncbi:MAG: hypothetical protein WBA46_06950 [Thermomicrobiales bacterium]
MSHSTLHLTDTAELKAHAERAAKARQEGMQLMRDVRTGEYFASSKSQPGTLHRVTLASCDCLGFVRHQHCRHHSALVMAHLLQELGPQTPTPDASGMTTIRNGSGEKLGMTYRRPDGWWSVFVVTPEGNRAINDRGSERAAVEAIWLYADRLPAAVDPIAEDPGVDRYFELLHQRSA